MEGAFSTKFNPAYIDLPLAHQICGLLSCDDKKFRN